MADLFSREKRSEIMGAVKSCNNKSTELRLIEYFRLLSIHGWKRNYKVIGRPDFVFPEKRVAIFVDGCFWHGHDCRKTKPSSNIEYWNKKIERNMKRDLEITKRFEKRKWTVIRIWECELKKKNYSALINKLQPILP